MSKPTRDDTPKPAAGTGEAAQHSSGRVQFDERSQGVWAWAVQTGIFDRNATTQRVQALSETTTRLEIAATPAKGKPAAEPKANAFTPYETPLKTPRRDERGSNPHGKAADDGSTGSDPYGRGPARSPESVTFNPYQRTPTRRR